MKTSTLLATGLAFTWPFLFTSPAFGQGDLNPPPGPPAPTMKSLDQIEPRIDVRTLPGDADNQFIIRAPGSYYLSANITGVANKNGIAVLASQVTIDLNGFALIGVQFSRHGILVPAAIRNLAVHHGTICTWGQSGINAIFATRSQFNHLHASDNGITGIFAGSSCSFSDCLAIGNDTEGIAVKGSNSVFRSCVCNENNIGIWVSGSGAAITDCTTSMNRSRGIEVLSGACTISKCTSNDNALTGINTGPGSTVQGCTTAGNHVDGIAAGFACTISGCTSRGNAGSGITVGNACQVTGNTCDANAGTALNSLGASISLGAGIDAPGDTCRIDGNSATANKIGIAASPGNLIIRNSARVNTTQNYSLSGNSTYGPIVTGSGEITTTSPWANFSY